MKVKYKLQNIIGDGSVVIVVSTSTGGNMIKRKISVPAKSHHDVEIKIPLTN